MSALEDSVAKDEQELPAVVSPYAGRPIQVGDHLKISAYWFATNFLWGALLVIMLPHEIKHMVPQYRAEVLGLLTGAAALVALVVPLIVGALSDRCASRFGRRRPYIAVGVFINLIGLAMMTFAYHSSHPIAYAKDAKAPLATVLGSPSILIFFLAYLVVQLGNNIASAAYSGVIPDLVPEGQRGAASGYMALMSQLGTLCGAVGCGAFLGGQRESVKYAVVGVVLLSVALVTIIGIEETPLPVKPPKIQWGSYAKSLWIDPKKYPDFAWVWITRALVMLGFYSVLPFINYYLGDVINVKNPDVTASMLIGVLLIASSISGIAGGYISDNIGRKRVVYLANAMIAGMALTFIACRTVFEVLIAGVFFGLGFGAYTSVDWALGTDVLPSKKDAAKEMAVWHIAMTLPQSIAAPFAGFLIAMFGTTVTPVKNDDPLIHYTIAGYSAVFVLCALCFGLGAYLLKNVRGVK